MVKKENRIIVVILTILLSVQSFYIFYYSSNVTKEFTTNSVLSSSIVDVFFPMAREAYADFSYVGTAVSLWGVSNSNMKKSILGNKYKYNIINIIDLNPKLKDIYYLTEGHFHGINKDLNSFSTDVLRLGTQNIPNYDRIWEFYFMMGMNVYLYDNDPASARKYFYEAYKVTGSNKYLRLYEISKHKDGKVFIGLMLYRKLSDNETEIKAKKEYETKFKLYQKAWLMQKNVKVYIHKFKKTPKSIEDLSEFVGLNLSKYKENLNKYNLIVSFNVHDLVVSVDLNNSKDIGVKSER